MDAELKSIPSTELSFDWIKSLSSHIQSELEMIRDGLGPVRNDPNYNLVRKIVLPYTTLKSRFKYQDSLKIAEIDSIHKVCPRSPLAPYFPSLLAYTSSILVSSIDIGGGPCAYTEYFQFRYVNSMTMGFSPTGYGLGRGWDLSILDPHKLIRFYGEDYTGDLLSQWKDFVKAAQQQFMAGVNFVSATSKSESLHDLHTLLQLYLTLLTIKDGANAIIRFHATWSDFLVQILYLATQTFEKVNIFQPLVSGSDSDELFLVLKHAKYNRKDYYISLNELFQNIPVDLQTIHGFIQSRLPDSFLDQIHQIKNDFVQMQVETLSKIQMHLREINDVSSQNTESVIIPNKLSEWSLPDAY
jgi:hypothetical protein